ncbi:hypothetical protein LA080_002581 [Diaporthe eres]|nr:hypothetical protein LA080_002581 [Diaporthe eres]
MGHTANTQSSASTRSGSPQAQSLLNTEALRLAHKAATVHVRSDGQTEVDPKEYEAVSLWEDLYHKVLLKGYSNNSQWPPYNQTDKAMDICTYYFANTKDGFRRLPLVFTECKRARNATSTKKGEMLIDCEKQLYGYCSYWFNALRPKGAEDEIFANAIVGPYIRCFIVKGHKTMNSDGRGTTWTITMTDFNGRLGNDDKKPPILTRDYLDVGNPEHHSEIRERFKTIRDKHAPEPGLRPNSSGSTGSARLPSTPVPSDAMSTSSHGSAKGSPPGPAQPGRVANERSASPKVRTNLPHRQRSPQERKTSGGH